MAFRSTSASLYLIAHSSLRPGVVSPLLVLPFFTMPSRVSFRARAVTVAQNFCTVWQRGGANHSTYRDDPATVLMRYDDVPRPIVSPVPGASPYPVTLPNPNSPGFSFVTCSGGSMCCSSIFLLLLNAGEAAEKVSDVDCSYEEHVAYFRDQCPCDTYGPSPVFSSGSLLLCVVHTAVLLPCYTQRSCRTVDVVSALQLLP